MSSQPPDDRDREAGVESPGRAAKSRDCTPLVVWARRVIVVFLIAGLGLTLLIDVAERRICVGDTFWENATRLRGIHQALLTYSDGVNHGRMPGMDADGTVTAASASERYAIMLHAKLFSPEWIVSPLDRAQPLYDLEKPVTPNHFSYALLEIATPGARRTEWAAFGNPNAAMVSDRNTGTDAGPDVWSVHSEVRAKAPRCPLNIWRRPFPTRGQWIGAVVYNDNHVECESSHIIGPTQYGSATPTDADNLFLDERSGDDAYMVAD